MAEVHFGSEKRYEAQRLAILAVNGSAAIEFSLRRASMRRNIPLNRPGVRRISDRMPIDKRGMSWPRHPNRSSI